MKISTGFKNMGNQDDHEQMTVKMVDADPHDVMVMLGMPTNLEDKRSQWVWIRFPNGDLVLATFPQGDTYERFSEADVTCKHCDKPIKWSNEDRHWFHREDRRKVCPVTTEAAPL